MVAEACRIIEAAEEAPSLAKLAETAGLSTFHFHRIFKSVTGVTPKEYAMAQRASRVREQLSRSATVTEAIYDSGFNSNSRFYEKSDRMLGMTPRDFRAGGANHRHPLRGRGMFPRRDPGGGEPEGHLRDPDGRRSGCAGAQPSGSLPARQPDRRRCGV